MQTLTPAGGTIPRHTDESIRKSIRLYLLTGLVLFCGTTATVLIATVPWLDVGEHGFDKLDAFFGIGIAIFKASLVAAIFMHLNHESRTIYSIISIGVIHLIGLFIGIYWYHANMYDKSFYQTVAPSEPLYINPRGAMRP